MNSLWLLATSVIWMSVQGPVQKAVPPWRPISPEIRDAVVRWLGFDPGFDQEKEGTWRGRPGLYVARRGASSVAVIDKASGRLCSLLNFADEPPLLDSSAAISKQEVIERVGVFLDRLGWRLSNSWAVHSCELLYHGGGSYSWHVVYYKWWQGVRLPAYLHIVMHAGTGTIITFRIHDDPVQPGLELRISPDEAVARVAARAGFARYEIQRLELLIDYDVPDEPGPQHLFWGMRLTNPDARSLSDSEVMWARVNAATGRIMDLGMPRSSSTTASREGARAREKDSTAKREMAALRRWTTETIRKTKWPRTVFEAAR